MSVGNRSENLVFRLFEIPNSAESQVTVNQYSRGNVVCPYFRYTTENMEFKLFTVKQQQNIFQINQTRLKYQFSWRQRTLNNGLYNILILTNLEALYGGNITYNLHQSKWYNDTHKNICPDSLAISHKRMASIFNYTSFFHFGCHDNHKNPTTVCPIGLTDCVKFINFSVPNNGDMEDCLFLYYEMINYDVTNFIVPHFLCWH